MPTLLQQPIQNKGETKLNTTNLTRKDLVVIGGYLTYEKNLNVAGHLIIDGDLGLVKFKFGIAATGSIIVKAGSGIEAGSGIKAGSGIISLRARLRAKIVSCLRIAVGFHSTTNQMIEAEIQKGDVILGKIAKPNPLPPVEYYWHIHHEQLVESLSEPIENRISYIKSNKPKSEIATHLRLLKKVEDQQALKKAINRNNQKTVDALHKKEYPNCPWNGHTIFPKEPN